MKKSFALISFLAVSALLSFSVFAGDGNVKTLDLKVVGMHCGGCEGKVKASLTSIDGVKEVQSVSAVNNSAVLSFDADKVSAETIVAQLKESFGYVISINESGAKTEGTKACCKGGGKTCSAAEKAACEKSKSNCSKPKSE